MNEVNVIKLPISKLLQGGKNMIAFCSAVQTSTDIALCWKYRFWLGFKIESVLFVILTSAGQEGK